MLFLIGSPLFGNFSEFRGKEKRSLYICFLCFPPLLLSHPFPFSVPSHHMQPVGASYALKDFCYPHMIHGSPPP